MEDCSIGQAFLKSLWEQQRGRCHYTDILLFHVYKTDWLVSAERLDRTRGYTEANTVLAGLELNHMLQWSTQNFLETLHLVDEPDQVKEEVAILQAKIDDCINPKPKKLGKRGAPYVPKINEAGKVEYECRKCMTYKPRPAFYERLKDGCKVCVRAGNRSYVKELRGFVTEMLNHARGANTLRNKKDPSWNLEFKFYFEDLTVLLVQQKGRCKYFGITMALEPNMAWKCSPERLDASKGYVEGNVVLVCNEFNSGYTQANEDAECSAQWSDAKFQYFLQHVHTQKTWFIIHWIYLYILKLYASLFYFRVCFWF